MDKSYHCHFCSKPIAVEKDSSSVMGDVFGGRCHSCPHSTYTFYDNAGRLDTADIVVRYKRRQYTLYFLFSLNCFSIYDERGPSSVSTQGVILNEAICQLNFIPDITPENVLDKLPTILTFQ